MMKKQTIFVCFVLDPAQKSAGREGDMRLVREEFQEEGIPFLILEAFPTEGENFSYRVKVSSARETGNVRNCQSIRSLEKVCPYNSGPVLLVVDSDRLLAEEKAENHPSVAYRHAGNESQKFEGAEWILEEPQYVDRDSYEKIWQRLTGNPWIIAETEHLRLREMTEKDLDALYALYDDPAVKRFLPPLSLDRNRERSILRAYIREVYGLYGYGMWAVCDRATGELIGRVGFEPYQGNNRAVELGYLIRGDRRGRGLAVEAARAAIRFADENLDFPAIAIRTDAENAASIHVALSLGFAETAASAAAGYAGAGCGQTNSRFTADREKTHSVDGRKSRGIRYFIREKPMV